MGRMRICPNCRAYTLKAECEKCESKTVEVGPAKFSPEDRYGDYRRRLKKENSAKG